MSLRQVIEEIVEEMENENEPMCGYVLPYAKQLRRALKASEGETAPHTISADGGMQHVSPELQHAAMLERAKQELRKAKAATSRAEDDAFVQQGYEPGTSFITLQGGMSDGVIVPIANNAPVGAKTAVGGEVYSKQSDGSWRLHTPSD